MPSESGRIDGDENPLHLLDVDARKLSVGLLCRARSPSATATASSLPEPSRRRAAARTAPPGGRAGSAAAHVAGPVLGCRLPAMERSRLPMGARALRAATEPERSLGVGSLGAPRPRKHLGRSSLGMMGNNMTGILSFFSPRRGGHSSWSICPWSSSKPRPTARMGRHLAEWVLEVRCSRCGSTSRLRRRSSGFFRPLSRRRAATVRAPRAGWTSACARCRGMPRASDVGDGRIEGGARRRSASRGASSADRGPIARAYDRHGAGDGSR